MYKIIDPTGKTIKSNVSLDYIVDNYDTLSNGDIQHPETLTIYKTVEL